MSPSLRFNVTAVADAVHNSDHTLAADQEGSQDHKPVPAVQTSSLSKGSSVGLPGLITPGSLIAKSPSSYLATAHTSGSGGIGCLIETGG